MLPLYILIPLAGLMVLSLLAKRGQGHLIWAFALLACLVQPESYGPAYLIC